MGAARIQADRLRALPKKHADQPNQDPGKHRLPHRFVLKNKETLRALVDAVIGTLGKVIEGWF